MTDYTPLIPNSKEEWELEMEVFDFLNNNPEPVGLETKLLIQKLWKEVVYREAWYFEKETK